MLKFAIIGAGAGGQSMAAILTSKGYIAKLYDIDKEKIHRLQELKTIKVTGVIACEAAPAVITDRIDEVMDDVDVIMVVSTTDAHRSIAYACKPYLKDGQIVMLNPATAEVLWRSPISCAARMAAARILSLRRRGT